MKEGTHTLLTFIFLDSWFFFSLLKVYLYSTIPDGTGGSVSSKFCQCILFLPPAQWWLSCSEIKRTSAKMLLVAWEWDTHLPLHCCHLFLYWPPTLPGRCSHLGQGAGVRTAKGSCNFLVILHFPESWWVLSGDGTIVCCGRDHLCEGVRLFSRVPQRMWNSAQNDHKPHCFSACTNDNSLPSYPPGSTEGYGFFLPKGWAWSDQCSSVLYFSPFEGAHIGHEDLSRWWEKAQWALSSAARPLEASVNAGRLDARSCTTHPKSSVCPTHPRASCDILPSSQSRECSQQCFSVNTHFMEKNSDFFFCWKFFINYFYLGKHDIILMVRKQTGRPAFCNSQNITSYFSFSNIKEESEEIK